MKCDPWQVMHFSLANGFPQDLPINLTKSWYKHIEFSKCLPQNVTLNNKFYLPY